MSTGDEAIQCALCGLSLGSGFPGATEWCSRCERAVLSKASKGNSQGILGDLILLGLGIGAGILAVKILDALSE